MGKRLFALFLAAVLLILPAGCTRQEPYTGGTIFCMDTVMDLQFWGGDCEEALEAVSGLLYALEEQWSATNPDSLVFAMNEGREPALTEEQQALLDNVEALSARTGGTFDPKLYSLTQLWGFPTGNYHVPDQEEIDAAKRYPLCDLGAAIKGYAGQEAAALLEDMDIDRAILNLGGNIQTYGTKADGSPWSIAIQNPEGGDYIGVVAVEGTASIITSGSYQRYFEENGVRYHHILDPRTGCPAESGLVSVTVICRDGLTADALSTALFVMGLEKGTELWRNSDDFEAVFLLETGEIYATEGAALSGCEFEVIAREK